MNAIEQAKRALEDLHAHGHLIHFSCDTPEDRRIKTQAIAALAALSAPAQKPDFSKCATFEEYRALSSAAGQEPVAWMWRYVGDDPIGHQLKPCARALHEMDPNNPPYPKHWQPEYALYPAPAQPQEQPVAAQQDGYCADCNSWGGAHDEECKRRAERFFAALPAQAPQQEAGQARELPRFLVRKTEQAIESATNPKGMRTNGPAYAQLEVSHLAALLRYARAAGQTRRSDESIIKTAQHMEAKRADFETKFKVDIWAVYGWLNENGFEPLALYERKSAQKGGGQ